jgi:transcriptional regulator with XRE-family HTH domain
MSRMAGDDLILTHVGANIKALREAKGWTLRDLAEATGEPAMTLWRLENAKNEPGYLTVRRLAKVFGVPVEYLERSPENSRVALTA